MSRVRPLLLLLAKGSLLTSAACDRTSLDVIVQGDTGTAAVVIVGTNSETMGEQTSPDQTSVDQPSVDQTSPEQTSPDDWESWGNSDPASGDGGNEEGGLPGCTGDLSLDEDSYRIRPRDAGCLTNGVPLSLPSPSGVRVSATELVVGADCIDDEDVQFRLVPGLGGWFELLHQSTQLNLDVLFADYTAGTPIVLYEPHGRSVQWFRFAPAREHYVTIAPERDANLCFERVGDSVQLERCLPEEPAQEWALLGPNCDDNGL